MVKAVPVSSLDSQGVDSAAKDPTAGTQLDTSDDIHMSESRRRSSRKSRNDELRTNEQNIATGSSSSKTTSTSKQMQSKIPSQFEGKDHDEAFEDAQDGDEDNVDQDEEELEEERDAGKAEAGGMTH